MASAGEPRLQENKSHFISPDNPAFQYTGRIVFSNPKLPRFWQPGVYIVTQFEGRSCSVILNDEVLWGNSHNYVDIVVDNKRLRYKMTGKTDTILAANGLENKTHRILICKDTEAGIGYLEFVGLICDAVKPPEPKPSRKIEFIGNSITCGSGMDFSSFPCGKGTWYDQHNAYQSYGPLTARALHAQWSLSAVSGIGLIHSCCNMTVVMPQVFDNVNMREDTIAWNFKKYQPDVITVCLGQNDGIQDSTLFCGEYIKFLQSIRSHYPAAEIICLTSPMADERLGAVLKNYLTGIVSLMRDKGDKKINKYFYSRQFHHGCGGHPDMEEHQQIAAELTREIRRIMHW
jgi:Carbohydrate esterase 2 N-terminal/GDSL-like Lipase/Acylhydrolase family